MSLGYAEKLSYREDLGGQLGSPEIFDEAEQRAANAQQLADLVSSDGCIYVKCSGILRSKSLSIVMPLCRSRQARQ